MAQLGANPPSGPSRFFKEARLEEGADGFAVLLDGRPAKTRRGLPLAAPSRALGEAVSAEWNAAGERLDLAAMPLTKALMTAIDLAEEDRESWRAVVLSFLRSDLVCYRATSPEKLMLRQRDGWDPLLGWIAAAHGVELKVAAGVTFIDQPAPALARAGALLDEANVLELLGVKAAAEISGSAVIALALWRGELTADALFALSQIDEDFQREAWGEDEEAAARTQRLHREFLDVARLMRLARQP